MKSNTLTIQNLRHTYTDGQKSVEVLKGLNTEFKSGKLYAVMGESGSGKTTFLSLISGLDRVQSGDILFNGRSINEIGESKFRLRYANIVFQSYNLIKYMTARENVEVAIDLAHHKGNEKEYAYQLLDSVGINRKKADRLVQKLSGGEQQRVAIARAMAGDVPVILADEPTGNLDEDTEARIMDIFKTLAEQGKIVIVVTHSKRVATHAHTNSILTLHRGIFK